MDCVVLLMTVITLCWEEKMNSIFYDNQKSLGANSNKIPRCLRKKLEMFVIRVNSKGNLVNSKPCNSCIYYMQLYGIKSVYYSNDGGEIIKEKLNDIESTHYSISQTRYYQYCKTNDTDVILTFNDKYRQNMKAKKGCG